MIMIRTKFYKRISILFIVPFLSIILSQQISAQSYQDVGLRVYDGTGTISIAVEPLGTLTSPLRIYKNGNIYGIALVDPSDPDASKIRIQASSGIKALRKYYPTGWVYQENADETNSVSYFVYMNYTKPGNAKSSSLWLVKHGTLAPYNVTIPADCWNYDANKLVFRVKSKSGVGDESYGACYNGTNWERITNRLTEGTGTGQRQVDTYQRILDGDWATGAHYSTAWYHCNFGICMNVEFYEESMWWFI